MRSLAQHAQAAARAIADAMREFAWRLARDLEEWASPTPSVAVDRTSDLQPRSGPRQACRPVYGRKCSWRSERPMGASQAG